MTITSTPTRFGIHTGDGDEWTLEVNPDGSLSLGSFISGKRCSMYYGDCRGADTALDIILRDEDRGDFLAALIAWLEQLP